MVIWSCIVPLPPSRLKPNEPTGSIGTRHAVALAEKAYKSVCTEIFNTCPIKGASFVVVSMTWYCVHDVEQVAQPNKKGVRTKTAIKNQPYYARDFGNAWGASKYLLDAIVEANIVPTDSWRHMSGGNCEVWPTVRCRKANIFKPGIRVVLEIDGGENE